MGNYPSRPKRWHEKCYLDINNTSGYVGTNRALGERHPQIVRLRIDNDANAPVTVELQTPGGAFLVGSQTVGADELEDLDALKATYDVVLTQGSRTETIRNLRLQQDSAASVTAILAGDLSGLPRDESARAVTETTRVDEFLDGEVLKTVVEEAKVAPSDRVGEALAKYSAQIRAEAAGADV